MNKLIFSALLCCAVTLSTHAQNYSITSYKIAGGGGTSSGGAFALTGTIGQPDAGGTLTGGTYSVTGGFWSFLSVVPTSGAPSLTITYTGSQAIISWPSSVTGWTLQTNSDLAAGKWSNYGATISNNTVTNSMPFGILFYRLTHP